MAGFWALALRLGGLLGKLLVALKKPVCADIHVSLRKFAKKDLCDTRFDWSAVDLPSKFSTSLAARKTTGERLLGWCGEDL